MLKLREEILIWKNYDPNFFAPEKQPVSWRVWHRRNETFLSKDKKNINLVRETNSRLASVETKTAKFECYCNSVGNNIILWPVTQDTKYRVSIQTCMDASSV